MHYELKLFNFDAEGFKKTILDASPVYNGSGLCLFRFHKSSHKLLTILHTLLLNSAHLLPLPLHDPDRRLAARRSGV